MSNGLPLDGYSPSQRRIIVAYEYMRFRPDGSPMARRIARELGYTLDKKQTNSYVSRTIRLYLKKRK